MTKTKKKSTKPSKPYWEMTTEELREATKEFDGPLDESQWRPLTKSERAKFERMQKGPHHSIFIDRLNAARLYKHKTPPLSKSEHTGTAQGARNGVAHPRTSARSAAKLFNRLDPQIVLRVEKYASKHEMSPLEFITKSLESSLNFVGG